MHTNTIEFAVKSKKGVVQEISKSTIYQPKIRFTGGALKWYEDKPKQKNS